MFVNSEKYSYVFRHQLKPTIRRKSSCLSSSGVYLLYHNSRPHTARHTVKQIQGLQLEVWRPVSRDLYRTLAERLCCAERGRELHWRLVSLYCVCFCVIFLLVFEWQLYKPIKWCVLSNLRTIAMRNLGFLQSFCWVLKFSGVLHVHCVDCWTVTCISKDCKSKMLAWWSFESSVTVHGRKCSKSEDLTLNFGIIIIIIIIT